MTDNAFGAGTGGRNSRSYFNDPKVRGVFYQALALACLALGAWWIISNTVANLQRAHISSGFGFLESRAGFDISQTLVDYSSNSTYGRALLVGFLNTLLVGVTGIVAATLIGFMVGIGRLSSNWLIARLCTVYVEVFRNIPPLLIVFFWYVGVISVLPQVREAFELPFSIFISNRGIAMPRPVFGDAAGFVTGGLVLAIILALAVAWLSKRRQVATGRRLPVLWITLALLIGLPAAGLAAGGGTVSLDMPMLGKFRLQGGMSVGPEFLSLFLSLSFYTAAYIAEIVRSGIMSVAKGQTEAAHALGLNPSLTTRLVVIPQAMRIVIPPLTSQYLNLLKDSSLAIAVGYADIVSVGGTILNQTGQAIEVIAIWAVVFLALSLAASGFMNWFNAKMALVER